MPKAGAAYATGSSEEPADTEALDAALKQLELSTEIRMNDKVEAMAGRMKEQQQRRIDDLNGRVIRLETVLKMALSRTSVQGHRLMESDSGTDTQA
jgi:hypothetical protein